MEGGVALVRNVRNSLFRLCGMIYPHGLQGMDARMHGYTYATAQNIREGITRQLTHLGTYSLKKAADSYSTYFIKEYRRTT